MGPGMVLGLGTGIALPGTHHLPTPGTPPHTPYWLLVPYLPLPHWRNMVVGLISVRQLTLDDQISGFPGITESYNLVRIGRIINH